MGAANILAAIAIGVSVASSFFALAFYLGVLSQRVTGLEQWRDQMNAHVDRVFDQLRNLERLIKNGDG